MSRRLAASLMDTLRAEWDSAVLQYRYAKQGLDEAESQLYAWRGAAETDPADLAEWQSLFNRVNATKSTVDAIETAAATVSGAWGSVRDTFGLSGRKGIAGTLGFVGLAPVAFAGVTVSGILVFVGSMVALTSAIWGFISYLGQKQEIASRGYIQQRAAQLEQSGVDPIRASEQALKEARAAAQQTSGYTLTTELRKMAMWAALGLGAVFIVPKLLERQ